MTTFSSGSFHGVAFATEATFGVSTYATLTSLRHTSCSLGLAKETFQSAELREDRQIADFRHGNQKPAGNIGIELSYGEFDTFLEAALGGTWDTNVLVAGTTQRSFCMERTFGDISKYQQFRGCVVNTLSLSVKPNAIVTGEFGMLARGALSTSTPWDAGPTASQTNAPYDSFTGVIKEGGATVGYVTAIELKLDNGGTPVYVIGDDQTPAIPLGRSNVTGSLDVYFQDLTMLKKFENETESSIEFTLGGPTKSYTFYLPRVKYGSADNPVSDEKPIVLKMNYQAIYNATGTGTTQTNIRITRVPA